MNFDSIFLTGATGVLGGHMMLDLLRGSKSTIYCLTRGNSVEEARDRLLSFLEVYDPEGHCREKFLNRVVPVVGDISKERFGLEPAQYDALVDKIDVTLHSAALTNLFLKLRTIEPVNVGGTHNIVDFALKTRSRYLCYVSTHTVMGDATFKKGVRFAETDYDIGQKFEYMTYQYTKFIGEGIVRAAKERGLIWNIMRPGQIYGDSVNGFYPFRESTVSGLFYDIFKTVIESRVALSSRTQFDVVPVDYVSRAILALAFEDTARFETYHLTNPDVKVYTEVISMIRDLGHEIDIVSEDEYKYRLLNGGLFVDGKEYKSPTTSAFRWWFRRGISFAESAITDCDYTVAKLANHGITCPPLDSELIRTYVDAAARESYLTLPHTSAPGMTEYSSENEQIEVVS